MNPFIIGLPAFIGGAFIGYLLREYSVGKLSAEQVGILSTSMRPTRLRYLWSMLAALALFFAARFAMPSHQNVSFLLFLGSAAILTVSFEVYGWRRSELNKLHRTFVWPFFISRVVTVSGTLVLIAAMAATAFMAKA
jgi:hypothetical protein